ncbi:Leucine-rich repeat domain superfamily [Sesbania bispinosa]|nr:Leucine-rich repeat domain superfamily [Sesbania bispinosa]
MVDRISALPDSLLCLILSFLPTTESVTTSVLSKRWKHLWRSVPALDFDDERYARNVSNYDNFPLFVNTVIITRNWQEAVQKFRLKCKFSPFCGHSNISTWIYAAAVQYRVEHLDLCFPSGLSILEPIVFPSTILGCTNLVILKLNGFTVNAVPSFALPELKILHLKSLRFSELVCLAHFLSGCPNVEDLKTEGLCFEKPSTNVEFRSLPKLVRADIDRYISSEAVAYVKFPLEVVSNVKFLRIKKMNAELNDTGIGLIPEFHNLISIELNYIVCNDLNVNLWIEVVEVLKHCPKVRDLLIDKCLLGRSGKKIMDGSKVIQLHKVVGGNFSCSPPILWQLLNSDLMQNQQRL